MFFVNRCFISATCKVACGLSLLFFDTKLMYIWSHLLCLALICYTCSVHSQRCDNDSQCDQGRVCCGFCASRFICDRLCKGDADCLYYGDKCNVNSGQCETQPYVPPTFNIPTLYIPTFRQYTPEIDICYWNSDCPGSLICEDGTCVDNDRNEGGFSWSGTKVIGIIFFVAVATVISCLYHMCKRARKPPVLATQNAPTTGATNTTHATDHEMRPSGNAVSNGGVVIAVEEVNEVSPPLPPGAPPPYSSLEFERQQRNENDEQPPPSYDEAVRNSTMALV